MESKTTECYVNVLEYVRDNLQFNPTEGYSDFEAAILSALLATFNGIHLTGCWFHYIYVSIFYDFQACTNYTFLARDSKICSKCDLGRFFS